MLNGSLRRHYVDCRQALRSVHLAGLIENRLLQTGRIWSFIRLAFRLALTRKGRTAADANSIDTERTIFVNNRADRPGLSPSSIFLGGALLADVQQLGSRRRQVRCGIARI